MRCWLLTLSLLLLSSPLAYGQQQYSEAACILLQQQIERFSGQLQLSTYRDSKRQFDKHCQNPITAPDKPLVMTNIPAKSAVKPASTVAMPGKAVQTPSAVAPATITAQVKKFDLGAMMLSLFTPYLPYIFAGLGILLLLSTVKFIWFGNQARIKGAIAERQLRRVLQRELPIGYHHYSNLVLPTAHGDFTEIDHLVLSRFGIFVIEVKNYKGWICGSETQEKWAVHQPWSKHLVMNPLRQNYKHTEAVKYLLELNSSANEGQVYSVIAFSSRAEFKTRMPTNVIFIEMIGNYLQQFTQSCFSEEQLRQFAARLNVAADSRKVMGKLHMQQFDA